MPLKINVFAVVAWIVSLPSYAELSDREQPMQIEADQVVLNQTQQISTFTGHVKFDQGTLRLRGEKIVVSQDAQGFKRALMSGNAASFRQKREGLNEYVEGQAQRIEYDANKQILDLLGAAQLKREGDFIRGEHIKYDSLTEVFQVNGAAQTANTPAKRVRAVLQPRSQVPVLMVAPNASTTEAK
jgi:lipopolysaccharide export system protein LptA